ncbi:hypothetical protein HBI83_015720 [Parastagonospora nodorum]|nr:hypothetical protein HBI83_015720 [Parastagonospora nodorum]
MLFLTSCAIEKVHIYAADSLSSTVTMHQIWELATAESITAKELLIARGNNILSLIAFIISYCLFADKLVYALNRATVVLIIILRSTPGTLLAKFIPTTKIRDLLLKTLENAAKSRILLACKHYNFNIYVSLATDTLHLLLKGLVMHSTSLKRFNNKRAFTELIAVVSLLFVSKAPFALHFIHAVYNLVTLAQYKRALERMNVFKEEFRVYQRTLGEEKNFNYPKALDSICTKANSEAHHITIVKQFYSMTNKKEVTRPLPFRRLRWSIPGIQPHLTKLPLSKVAANIAISDFIYAAAVFRSSSKRHNDSKHCDEEVRRDYVWVQEFKHRDNRRQSRTVTDNGKYIAYIEAFSEVLLFNNNRQIDNTTRMLSMPFKFYDLSTIIRLVHLVSRDLPNLTTRTTMSYYVNNYIN